MRPHSHTFVRTSPSRLRRTLPEVAQAKNKACFRLLSERQSQFLLLRDCISTFHHKFRQVLPTQPHNSHHTATHCSRPLPSTAHRAMWTWITTGNIAALQLSISAFAPFPPRCQPRIYKRTARIFTSRLCLCRTAFPIKNGFSRCTSSRSSTAG